MKALHSALLAVGAGLAGAVAVWMTVPPPMPVEAPAPVVAPQVMPPVVVPQPPKPSPAPRSSPTPQRAPEVASAPPPVYSEPPHVLRAKTSPPPSPAPAPVTPARVPAPNPVPYQEPTPRAAPKPAEPQPEPSGRQVTLEQGQDVAVRVLQKLSAENMKPGDLFHGELAEPLVANGLIIGERGAPVRGRVVEVQRGGFFGGGASITLRLLNFLTADGQHVEVSTEPWTMKGASGETVIRFRLAVRITITERRL